MAINEFPIEQVTLEDVGSKVSYQCAGMATPDHGVISGLSLFSERTFVKFGSDQTGKLTDLYNLRWGHCGPWLYKDGNQIK